MKSLLSFCLLTAATLTAAPSAVETYEGTVTIPTYEHIGRELEPPLFANSTVTGMYPFTTYLPAYKPGPNPQTYHAIFLENEYLKLTYIPDFGDRIFSVYDKLRSREMLYRNDVIKPAPYNPRDSWPQSGMELTGPHDLHTLTLHSEPYWANKIVRHEDGSIALALGEIDPVYGMQVNLTVTLHPGISALEISVFCYNTQDGRKPQMFWINTAINATPKTRFIYPMSRTVGHTTAEVADWPLYNGIDYSLDRNNRHMLGVFGIDIYDNFQGAYQFDRDYGIFRFADRRIVQGMKLWTFGYGSGAKNYEAGYTDHAGPYVELQSGRHVWDGHYEWVAPHKVEGWNEWWVPISQTGGLTTLTRDLALNLDVQPGSMKIALGATRIVEAAKLSVEAKCGKLLETSIDLDPAKPFRTQIDNIHANADGLTHLIVTIQDATGNELLRYERPDDNPGRKEYTPFTSPLEHPHKSPDEMGVEELTLAGEYALKELDEPGAMTLFNKALERDPGYSRAHLLIGITAFNDNRYDEAVTHLTKVIERDAYNDAAYFYLAMSQFALDKESAAERNLYYIWPESAYYGEREFHLGRLALRRHAYDDAITHFRQATNTNAEDGGQTQEAIAVTSFYRTLAQWKDTAQILQLVGDNNHDPWGTTPVFYYTLAYCQRRTGDNTAADASLLKARAATGKVDRFPYREETEAALAEAVERDPNDITARFDLACLLYFRGHAKEAIAQWQTAIQINPQDFSSHRALGLAFAEQGFAADKAIAELERAVALNPAHLPTLDDLSATYARAGRFNDQLALLTKSLARSPSDDDLAEGLLTANLNMGRYSDAERLIETHRFATRHRSYSLRDKYRLLRFGMGAEAFNHHDYRRALALFESASQPPVSLGVDTFENQTSPRLDYYRGRTLEALGRHDDAHRAYMKSIAGLTQLSGDRDSWSSDNFFMVLSLDQLGRPGEATQLEKHFANFADTERADKNPDHRAAALYLLGLISQHDGHSEQARTLLTEALDARPDLLAARLDLRGDVLPAASKPN